MKKITVVSLLAAKAVTATDTGSAVDIADFTGNVLITLNSRVTGGAGQTADVKLQHSADGSTNWTDTGFAFDQVTSALNPVQSKYVSVDGFKKFVRIVNTLGGGSPTHSYAVTMAGEISGN